MEKEARKCLYRLIDKDWRWLIYSGPTEVGKSHLCSKIKSFIYKYSNEIDVGEKWGFDKVIEIGWSFLIDQLRYEKITLEDISKCGLLIINDLLSSVSVNSGNIFASINIDKAYDVLECRQGKATIITTNNSIEDFTKIDPRIASRLMRNDAVWIDIPSSTKGYLER